MRPLIIIRTYGLCIIYLASCSQIQLKHFSGPFSWLLQPLCKYQNGFLCQPSIATTESWYLELLRVLEITRTSKWPNSSTRVELNELKHMRKLPVFLYDFLQFPGAFLPTDWLCFHWPWNWTETFVFSTYSCAYSCTLQDFQDKPENCQSTISNRI